MEIMNFGVLVAQGFKKLILDSKTFYVRTPNDPIYQFSKRECVVVTDYTTVCEVEQHI